MSQELLKAIGARLEAQLNAKVSRHRSIEDSVKAQVETNPPAAFILLPDGTKQFGYAPSTAVTVPLISNYLPLDSTDAIAAFTASDTPAEAEIVSDTAAPIADLLSATARIFSAAAAETRSVEHLPVEANQPALVTPAAEPQVFSAVTACMDAVFAKPAVQVEAASVPTPVATASTPTSPMLTATAAANVATATPTSVVASAANLAYTMLSNGTKQFGFAPSGGLVNTVLNKTPPVPAEFGVGATIRRPGVSNDVPIAVTRVGDGVVFANFTDAEGTREMAFYPNQMELMTAAP